jgi:predicted transcriptional regulator
MGIDMTCIDLSVEDLLGCSFGLSKREVAVLLRLLHAREWVPVSDIAAKTRRDRSVVQRTLQKLVEKGIAERSQHNRPGGGYEFLYKARGKKALKAAITEKSRMFCLKVAAQVREW